MTGFIAQKIEEAKVIRPILDMHPSEKPVRVPYTDIRGRTKSMKSWKREMKDHEIDDLRALMHRRIAAEIRKPRFQGKTNAEIAELLNAQTGDLPPTIAQLFMGIPHAPNMVNEEDVREVLDGK